MLAARPAGFAVTVIAVPLVVADPVVGEAPSQFPPLTVPGTIWKLRLPALADSVKPDVQPAPHCASVCPAVADNAFSVPALRVAAATFAVT